MSEAHIRRSRMPSACWRGSAFRRRFSLTYLCGGMA